jgi:hypothetical protein
MPVVAFAQNLSVVVTVKTQAQGAALSPQFLGLSYETLAALPNQGHYYFDAKDVELVNLFKTLGIKSLRIGGSTVDSPAIPIPQENDIDSLFSFGRAAGVKVIYSFRLKNGMPADSARLASYIAMHDADVLDSFSIGNEPRYYIKKFPDFLAQWKLHYDAILKVVPQSVFVGPCDHAEYAQDMEKAVLGGLRHVILSEHYYFLGGGWEAEKNLPESRARLLSNNLLHDYENDYAQLAAPLAAAGVPCRLDEMNSCSLGGARDLSDSYASSLWALDCTHWWAAHRISGVNYHTGELSARRGKLAVPNYAAFLRQPNGQGFIAHPLAYGLLAFSQGAHGKPLDVQTKMASAFDFNAYAYQANDGSIYVTLINKSFDDNAHAAMVSIPLPQSMGIGVWQRMDLAQKNQDITAKTDITLGGAPINAQGIWPGQWEKINANTDGLTIQVAAASATILRFSPTVKNN